MAGTCNFSKHSFLERTSRISPSHLAYNRKSRISRKILDSFVEDTEIEREREIQDEYALLRPALEEPLINGYDELMLNGVHGME